MLALFSCSCLDRSPASKITFPDKSLEEIIIMGGYSPGGEKAMEWLKNKLIEEELLKEGESVEEAIKDRYQDDIKEYFNYSEMRYCYHKTNDRKPVFNRNLRARLYDRRDTLLKEDFLRLEKCCRFHDDDPWVVSYLPYHDEGHEIRIVRLEGTKEIVLHTFSFIPHARLLKVTRPDTQGDRHPPGIVFDTRDNCHVTPGTE